ncbi:MAG TPA: tryptophan synthase subunit alpha [bacterium]|jgi:tryptophan synthase alpha chain|nr:tryptophan synthase subunit alpha [bacterium]
MSRISATFAELRAAGRRAFIPFVVAGDPDLAATEHAAQALVRAGADLIEFGVPFSDPIADGPVNQRAGHRALLRGVTLADVLDLTHRLRPKVAVPVVLLSYFNPILQYGLNRFCADAASSGVDGVVVPDLPPEEADGIIAAARPAGVDTIFLLAPTSTDERIRLVAERSTGFIYCVSLTGVTGVRERVSADLGGLIARIKGLTSTPVCVGFGVSTPDQAREVARVADGVIVGSALVAVLEEDGDRITRLEHLAGTLRRGIDVS